MVIEGNLRIILILNQLLGKSLKKCPFLLTTDHSYHSISGVPCHINYFGFLLQHLIFRVFEICFSSKIFFAKYHLFWQHVNGKVGLDHSRALEVAHLVKRLGPGAPAQA